MAVLTSPWGLLSRKKARFRRPLNLFETLDYNVYTLEVEIEFAIEGCSVYKPLGIEDVHIIVDKTTAIAAKCSACVVGTPKADGGCSNVRLYSSATETPPTEGRLEIFHAGEFGSVCDDNFGKAAAEVVCRQLGFIGGVKVEDSSVYGPAPDRIWLDEVDCDGTEEYLEDCGHYGWGVTDCSHHEDVGLRCTAPAPPSSTSSEGISGAVVAAGVVSGLVGIGIAVLLYFKRKIRGMDSAKAIHHNPLFMTAG